MIEEGVQEDMFGERRFYRAAADLSALGIGRPHIGGRDRALPLLEGELDPDAAVLECDHDCELVQARARESFLLPPMGSTGSVKILLLRESITLLHYPLWSLQYRYKDLRYGMTVDARSGVVHSARAPADNRRRIAIMLASYTALALALGVVVWLWFEKQEVNDILTYAIIVIGALTATFYWRFRLAREVEYHEPFSY